MTTPFRSVLLTPNILGTDGVSRLSREISRALPGPSLVVGLHDPATGTPGRDGLPADISMRGAEGNRARFLAEVAWTALRCTPETAIVCSHLHLAPAARLLQWRGCRTTFVLCGIEAWAPIRTAERWALERGDLVAISRHTVDRFKIANPALATMDVAVCHPGLPGEVRHGGRDRAAPPGAPSAAAGLGAGPRIPSAGASPGVPPGPMALIVGRMSAAERYKGHDDLLDVWPDVLERHPGAQLVVAGNGTDRVRLERKAASRGLSRVVRFVGTVSDGQLNDLYDQCRFFVMPSRDEGFGLVFLEAMRAAKPCIGGRGAASEIIEHDVTGLLVNPDRHEELLAAILRLYDEPGTCCRFGLAGRARFLSAFTEESFQARFRQALDHGAVAPGVV